MKRVIIVLVIIAGVGAGAGAYYMRRGGPEMSVLTAPITRGDLVDAVSSTGTLQAVTTVTVGSQVSGNIASLGADFNSIVHKGQIIANLDPALFQASVNQSKGSLANSKAQLEKDKANRAYLELTFHRDEDLVKRKLITQDALDAAKSQLDQVTAQIAVDTAMIQQAQAQLDLNQTNLDHTIITAPIDGIVIQRSVDVGQTVQASMTAPTLFILAADLTKMQVSAQVDEADVGRIRPGQRVTFHVDAYAADQFEGTVSQIRLNPVVVQNVTTYATIVDVPNNDLRLKPGMTANLKIEVARRNDALRVPNSAIRFRPNQDMFAALNEPVPPEAQLGGRGRGGRAGQGGGAGRNAGGSGTGQGAGTAAGQGTGQNSTTQTASASAPQGGGGANRQPRADGGQGGGGRGGDPAQRLERFKALAPDQQQQFIARLKGRGQDTSAFEAAIPKPAASKPTKGAAFQPKYGGLQSASTIDALFSPLPTIETRGRVWLFIDRQLKPATVRLGITDGTYTELLDNTLQPNQDVVTGVTGVGSVRPQAAGANGNPLLGNQRGGPGRGF